MQHIAEQPTSEPIELSEMKDRLGNFESDDVSRDSSLIAKISAARQLLEIEAGTLFIARNVTSYSDIFQSEFRLVAPVQSVSSVKYYDENGVQQTVNSTNYYLDKPKNRLVFKSTFVYPTIDERPNNIEITYTAGHTTTPNTLKEAIFVLVGQWEVHQKLMQLNDVTRPMTIPNACIQLLNGYREFRNIINYE